MIIIGARTCMGCIVAWRGMARRGMTKREGGHAHIYYACACFVYVNVWCSGLCDKTGAVRELLPSREASTRLLLMRALASKGCAAVRYSLRTSHRPVR